MKSEKWIIRIGFVIGAILLFWVCTKDFFDDYWPEVPYERQKELRAQFYEANYMIPDTVIRYELYSDSLVLIFEPNSHYYFWETAAYLRDTTGKGPSHALNNSALTPVVNGKIKYRGFHIPEEKLKDYSPEFDGIPKIPQVLLWPVKQPYMHIRFINHGNNILKPRKMDKNFAYYRFNMKVLNGLTKDEQDYCKSIIQQELDYDMGIDLKRFD